MDEIIKVPNLCNDTTDAYVQVGDSKSYLEKFNLRKLPITNDTEEISCGLIAKRLQQTIDAVNKLIEVANEKNKK